MITNTNIAKKGDIFPGAIVDYKKDGDKIYFQTENGVTLKVTVLRDSVINLRFSTENVFEPDFSYALSDEANYGYNKLEINDLEDYYELETSKLKLQVHKINGKTKFYDLNGTLINEDEQGFHWEENYDYGGNIVKMSKISQEAENYYGLGDKPMHSNLKGKRMQNWVTDQYAFGKDKDPIYKAIPFYIGLHHGVSYGIFFDNTFKTFFDFCQERRGVTSFWADGGEMNYYFIYGPSMPEVVVSYTDLTGKPELPPLWALGYHQSKWSYYPEQKVREVASKFRELQIPCDGIYLDIDYMEGFRCFTWNKDYFPEFKGMVKDLENDGFKTVAIIDPGIKIDKDYKVYQEALENDYFCKRADGPYMKGKVWPGECNFPDFTNPDVREWWSEQFKELIGDVGIKGIWNDMNEPAVMEVPTKTFPLDVRHDYDGHPCSHRKAHNIYGMQMARATQEGVKKFAFPKRPFVITRSAYSGTQRFTSTWTGDNVASWEHLWLANVQIQRLCLSGMSFAGTDIGGFAEQPSGELYARWIQLGVFHPFCRTHSSGDHGNQEPWSFDEEVLDIVRKFINLRYQLLPYLYTMFWEYAEEGVPMLKSLYYYDQEDEQTYFRTDEFVFGNQILVAPVQEPNAKGRRMYIPRGTWFNYWTDEPVEGGKEMYIEADLDKIPLFVKEGAIIPKYPVQQYIGEKIITELSLDVYYKIGKEKSIVYEDSGDGYDYKKGRYSLRTFKYTGREKEIIIQQHKEGKYDTSYDKFVVTLHGIPFKISHVQIDNVYIPLENIKLNGDNSLEINKEFTELHLIGV
ncbi:glycoside hydrolase family 31 protein [Zhouia sp. PK063]|uniref:glycoside hydrolase family 31 protein n=1 Tax=Zhouia sp. PK063 TaxID=3373602 RepID=UPI0037AD2E3D